MNDLLDSVLDQYLPLAENGLYSTLNAVQASSNEVLKEASDLVVSHGAPVWAWVLATSGAFAEGDFSSLNLENLSLENVSSPIGMIPEGVQTTLLEGRTSYPRQLMFFYLLHQATLFAQQEPLPPNERFNISGVVCRFLMSFVCYAYPASTAVDAIIHGIAPNVMKNSACLVMWLFLFLTIHYDLFGVNSFVMSRGGVTDGGGKRRVNWVQLLTKIVFMADISRAGYVHMERADGKSPGNSELEVASRLPLVVWTALIRVAAPCIYRAIFYGKNNFWRHPPGASFVRTNYTILVFLGSMLGYYLYMVTYHCIYVAPQAAMAQRVAAGGNSTEGLTHYSGLNINTQHLFGSVLITRTPLKQCCDRDPTPFVVGICFTAILMTILDLKYIFLPAIFPRVFGEGSAPEKKISKGNSAGSSDESLTTSTSKGLLSWLWKSD